MRPALGVLVESVALVALVFLGFFIPKGIPYLLYVVAGELLATYLIHCPAHYLIGRVLGIRFVRMNVGRTTLAKALPPRLSRFARLAPILTLATDRSSLGRAGKRRASAMFASGTVASILSAFAVAAWVVRTADPILIAGTWLIAFGYLAFDAVFSPRTGDLMRARRAWRSSATEPVRAQE